MCKTNHFEEVDYGIFSEGKTPYSNQGLTFKCNEFEPTTIEVYDLFVREGTIDKVQGFVSLSIQPNPTALASGNFLSHTRTYSTSDIEVYPVLKTKISYTHHFEASRGPFAPD